MRIDSVFLVMAVVVLGACQPKTPVEAVDKANASPESTESTTSGTASEEPPLPANAEPLLVEAQLMSYSETDDGLIRGYFAYPQSMVEPLPAILLIHDWWGLDQVVKDTADRLASDGYMVLAVDLFDGKVATSTPEAAALSRDLIEQTDAADSNIKDAHRFLTAVAGAPDVASMGWSMGGYWAVKTTRLLPGQVGAAVNFYGQIDDDPELIQQIDAPLLGLFGANDRSVETARIRDYSAVAKEAGLDMTLHVYPEVSSGFANPEDARYNVDVAEDAWQRTMVFLNLHLR
ncbi:MAG: dienelactone hydrolase family protein [Woeseiaceae bacterium]